MMRIGIACDHGGFELKERLLAHLNTAGYQTRDLGAGRLDPDDDYPDYVFPLAEAVGRGDLDRGIAVCGSGVGACILANKVRGVRAALIHENFSARQGVEDDNMNLICLGGRVLGDTAAWEMVQAFLNARFSGAERHRRRLGKIASVADSQQLDSPVVQTDSELRRLNKSLEQQVREQTSAVEMLRDVAFMANLAGNVEEALEYCLRRVAEHNGWTFGHAFLPSEDDPNLLLPAYVWYPDEAKRFHGFRDLTLKSTFRRGEPLPGRVYATGKPDWITDVEAELGVRRVKLADDLGLSTAAAFPLLVGKAVVGVLEFFSEKSITPDDEMLGSMASVGTQLGRVIERKLFQDQLLTLAEEEHRRIGQELHDDVGQELTGVALKAETLAELLGGSRNTEEKLAEEIVVALDRTRGKARALSQGLVPTEVDAPGLEAALEGLALRMAEARMASCTFRCRGDHRVSDSRTATQLYRIAQEAVANAMKHAETTNVEITLDSRDAATVLEIRDNGQGLRQEEDQRPGVGLEIMRYRAELIGGKLTIASPPCGGTSVTCSIGKEIEHEAT